MQAPRACGKPRYLPPNFVVTLSGSLIIIINTSDNNNNPDKNPPKTAVQLVVGTLSWNEP